MKIFKNKNKSESLPFWLDATTNLVLEFVEKYYDKEADFHWVGDEIGGVLAVNDEFWGINGIVHALTLNPDADKLFEWYYYAIDLFEKNKSPMTLENYLKLNKP